MGRAEHRELYELAAKRDGVFTTADALDAKLTKHEIREAASELWRRLHHGVFLAPGASLTVRATIRAACTAGAPNAAASHRTGAWMYEVPGGRDDLAEVTCPRWLRTTTSGLIVHETKLIDPVDITEIDGIPVMRPERVLIELASIYKSSNFIETVLHAMLRKKLVTVASCVDTFRRLARRGRPGIAIVRVVLSEWDGSLETPESPPETRLVQILQGAGLGRVLPQMVVRDKLGNFVARVDVGLPDRGVTVEYDSDQEHGDVISNARDNARRIRIARAGWFPMAARKADIRSGGRELIEAIRAVSAEPA
jgi:hypothetical protein